jgi:Aerotolerance regulator N-terminal
MTFLQPILLAALPLVTLPVIIHLINQRRYQSIRWAAMIFLLAANRMSRGYAKLRQLLILLFRMLAVAALIFAVSRPLARGWLGRAGGGRPDTTIILLDRSPSMRQQGPGTVVSKLEAGRHQLARTLAVLGSGRWVLIESTSNVAREIESPDALLKLTAVEPASSSADLPAMLEAARDYIRANRAGRTEIWICSDLRQNDWNADSVRWQALRDSFLEFPQGVRIHLLAYADAASGNVAVRVTNVRRQQTADGAELLVSLKLTREGNAEARVSLPVQFEIEGARSELTVEMDGPTYELKDHRIPIERTRERGWGKVSVPADANPADNDFYFVFDRPQPRHTLIVGSDPQSVAALQLAASISPDPAIPCAAEIITRDQLATADWEGLALLVWHAPLPDGDAAQAVQAFINRGGQVVFLPPRAPGDAVFLGARWQNWTEEQMEIPVETWRGDQDVLANTQSGAALPVGQLRIRRWCGLEGELTPLASVKGGRPLLARLPSNRGGVYFCATTPDPGDSSLAANGVVLYVFVQRALAAGAVVLGQTRQLVAGDPAAEQPTTWRQLAGTPDALSTEYAHHAGVYAAGEKLLAVNRSAAEDQAAVLAEDRVAELFKGLNFTRVDDRVGSLAGLIQEIWRPFLVVMMIALLVEAGLCLPRRGREAQRDGSILPVGRISAAFVPEDLRAGSVAGRQAR